MLGLVRGTLEYFRLDVGVLAKSLDGRETPGSLEHYVVLRELVVSLNSMLGSWEHRAPLALVDMVLAVLEVFRVIYKLSWLVHTTVEEPVRLVEGKEKRALELGVVGICTWQGEMSELDVLKGVCERRYVNLHLSSCTLA